MILPIVAAVVLAFMLIEALRAARNERAQRAAGGVEPPDDVYRWMQIAYPGAFAAMCVEGLLRHEPPPPALVAVGALVFVLGKALKWWAILSLGRFWTFRVIVVPGARLVDRGPYRLIRHPNYVGVVLELVSVALMTGARVTGPLATSLFTLLIVRRIAVEERALGRGSATGPSV
jgi:methyltransferase